MSKGGKRRSRRTIDRDFQAAFDGAAGLPTVEAPPTTVTGMRPLTRRERTQAAQAAEVDRLRARVRETLADEM